MSPPLLLLLLLALPLLATASEEKELVRKKRFVGERTLISCDFDGKSWCAIQHGAYTDFTWSLNSGPTPSSETGPPCDHTSCSGYYAYTDSTSRLGGGTARLQLWLGEIKERSKCLRFYYHMHGAAMGRLDILVANLSHAQPSDQTLFTVSGDQGNVWHSAAVTVPRGTNARDIVFSGTVDSASKSDIAIDDVILTEGATCSGVMDLPYDPCASTPCNNGGSCIENDQYQAGFYCQCNPDFWGGQCEQKNCPDVIDPHECMMLNSGMPLPELCDRAPCQNGGTCIQDSSAIFGFRCLCPSDFQGEYCQKEHDDCRMTPCQNNGTCTGHSGNYSCSCPPGYGGTNCELDADECLDSPCLNSGTCINSFGGYFCICPVGFRGSLCEKEVPKELMQQALLAARRSSHESQRKAAAAKAALQLALLEADNLRRRR